MMPVRGNRLDARATVDDQRIRLASAARVGLAIGHDARLQ
jgi:hypothetical protein